MSGEPQTVAQTHKRSNSRLHQRHCPPRNVLCALCLLRTWTPPPGRLVAECTIVKLTRRLLTLSKVCAVSLLSCARTKRTSVTPKAGPGRVLRATQEVQRLALGHIQSSFHLVRYCCPTGRAPTGRALFEPQRIQVLARRSVVRVGFLGVELFASRSRGASRPICYEAADEVCCERLETAVCCCLLSAANDWRLGTRNQRTTTHTHTHSPDRPSAKRYSNQTWSFMKSLFKPNLELPRRRAQASLRRTRASLA